MTWIFTLIAWTLVVWLFIKCCVTEQSRLEQRFGFSKQDDVSETDYCELMNDIPKETALTVRGVLADVTGWEPEEIHPQTKIIEFEIW
jgi:hypothetical protein